MASVELTLDVPMTPQDMWDHVADLSDLGDWLVMHEGWRSELPDEIAEGTQIIGVARAKGMRNRVTWTVTKWDPPHEVAMSGAGKGGTKYGVRLTVGPPATGPPSVCGWSWAVGRCSGRSARPPRVPSKAMWRSRCATSSTCMGKPSKTRFATRRTRVGNRS